MHKTPTIIAGIHPITTSLVSPDEKAALNHYTDPAQTIYQDCLTAAMVTRCIEASAACMQTPTYKYHEHLLE